MWLVLSGRRREAEETAQRLWGPEGALQLGGGALPPCARLDYKTTARDASVHWEVQVGDVCISSSLTPTARALPRPRPADKTAGGSKGDAGWGEVLSSRSTALGVTLFVLQQFSGINAIVYFSSSVFQVFQDFTCYCAYIVFIEWYFFSGGSQCR